MTNSARVALITGCGKPVGIGNSTARALAAAGITVVVSDVAPTGVANEHNVQGDVDPGWAGVDSLVEAIRATGGTASATLGDVSQEADAVRMVDDVLQRHGRLDILVNNAGAPQGADRNEIENVPVAAWDLTDGGQRQRGLPDVACRGTGHAQGGMGPDHQCVVASGVSPWTTSRHLCGFQGRHRRLHQVTRA